jgi:hypothetical protein
MKLVMRDEDVMNSLGFTVAIPTLRVVDDIGETLVAHRFNPKSNSPVSISLRSSQGALRS